MLAHYIKDIEAIRIYIRMNTYAQERMFKTGGRVGVAGPCTAGWEC